MKQIITLLLASFFVNLAHAGQVTIQNRNNGMLTGMINKEIATNYEQNSVFRNLYWQSRSGEIVSEKPYYIVEPNRSYSIRFCIQQTNRTPKCSSYYQTRIARNNRSIQVNSGSLTNVISNGESLNASDVFSATTSFNISNGQFSYLYHQVEDQDGNVLSAKFTRTVISQLNNISLPAETSSVRSCSIGGFTHGFPASISNCSDAVNVINPNDEPVYQNNTHMFYTQWGPFDNRQQGRDACNNSSYSNFNDWRLVKANERPMTTPLNRVREAPYNLQYSGQYEVGLGMADDTFFYWTYATTGQIVEHKFVWSSQQLTYDTAICTRLK